MSTPIWDAIVIGGGPAGLQAALTLGRMHRAALVLDSGDYRNAPAGAMHNVITHDGRPPADHRAMAHADIAHYDTVELRQARVHEVRRGDVFEVALDDGQVLTSHAVLLATGVRDVLPPISGVAELFGSWVHHCPFCHGHEFSGRVVGVQGSPRVHHLVPLLRPIADTIVVMQHDWQPMSDDLARLAGWDAVVVPGLITQARVDDDALVLEVEGGTEQRVDGLFVASDFVQSTPFSEQLGLTLLASGCMEVDAFGRTSMPGVYAAGDAAHVAALPMPMMAVQSAAAAGGVAAATLIADSLARV